MKVCKCKVCDETWSQGVDILVLQPATDDDGDSLMAPSKVGCVLTKPFANNGPLSFVIDLCTYIFLRFQVQ